MMSTIGNRGFTLLEVLIATAILSLGLVMIYQAFFICLDTFDYCLNHLKAQLWLDEKVRLVQDNFRREDIFSPLNTSGQFIIGSRNFNWHMDYSPIELEELYKINLEITWQQGSRMINMSRVAYVSNFVSQ